MCLDVYIYIYTYFDIVILIFFHSWCFIRHLAREITNLPRFNRMKNTWKWHFFHAKQWDSDFFLFRSSICFWVFNMLKLGEWNSLTVWPFPCFFFGLTRSSLSVATSWTWSVCLRKGLQSPFRRRWLAFGGDDVIIWIGGRKLSRYTVLETNSHRYGLPTDPHIGFSLVGLAARFREKNPTTADLKIFFR